ncbi:hypothetical protein V8C35DRAFT_307747 [Trichoderma chlorosporum]
MNDQPPEPAASAMESKHDDGAVDGAGRVMSDPSIDESDEILETDIRDAMNNLGRVGGLLSFHTLSEYSGGISIKGVGNISMPLEEEQAQQISALAREDSGQSDGEHHTRLDPTNFTLDDEIWPNIAQGFLDQASRNLGVATPLRAKPFSMILLKCGVNYSEHLLRSEPKALGSLVVILPSRHEGGEIVAKHRETEKVLFAPSQAAQSFTTWHHNINSLEIRSGYLWLLIYTVETDANLPKLDAENLELPKRELQPLHRALRRWMAKDRVSPSQGAFYYPFKEKYEPFRVHLNNLKPEDNMLVQHLRNVATDLPFDLFLAVIKKRQEGSGASPHHKVDSSKDYIARIFNVDGFEATNDGLITKGALSSLDADSPRVAVIIIPHDKIIPFFYGCDEHGRPHSGDGAWSLLGSYARICYPNAVASTPGIVFQKICHFMMTPTPENMKKSWIKIMPVDCDLLDVLKMLLSFGLYSCFSYFVENALELPDSFLLRFRRWLNIADDREPERMDAIEKALADVIVAKPQVAQQIAAIKKVIDSRQERALDGTLRLRPEALPSRVLRFVRRVVTACVETCENKQLVLQDAQAFAEFALYFDDPFELLSLVRDKINMEHQPTTMLGLIHRVHHYGKSKLLLKEECLKFTREIAKSLFASITFLQWRGLSDGRFFTGRSAIDNMIDADSYEDDDTEDDEYCDDVMDESWDDWDFYEEFLDVSEREHFKENFLDDRLAFENLYRAHLHRDDDDRSMRRLSKDRYESKYGKAKPAYPTSGVTEKGVHFKSLFCFIHQLLDEEDQSDGVLEFVVSKVVDAAPQIQETEFHNLWMPFVKEFIPNMESLESKLGYYKKQLLARLLSAIMKAYVDTWVGRYPERPTFARPGVRCSCPDCKGLNVFLGNRLLRVGRFKADFPRIRHLLHEMAQVDVDFKWFLEQDADSATMIVKKTERLVEEARKQWANRRLSASKQIAKFGQTGLEFVFGTEWMSFLSMADLGGIGFDILEMRTLMGKRTALSKEFIKRRFNNMFWRGLPWNAATNRKVYPTRRRIGGGRVNRLAFL